MWRTAWPVSLGCVLLLAGCKSGQGEACAAPDACEEGLVCKASLCHDPAQFCRSGPPAEACRREGRCQLMGEECAPATEADCTQSTRCKELGVCKLANGCCSLDDQCRPVEEDPVTHVERLGDAGRRDAAIEKLAALYDSALGQDKGDPRGEHAQRLADLIVPPLAAMSARAKLPPARQGMVLDILAKSRHPKAGDALVEALRLHRPSEAPVTPVDAAMSEVLVAIAEQKLGKAAPHVLSLFVELRASSPQAEVKGFARNLERALIVLAETSWEQQLLKKLEPRVDSRGDLKKWRDQVYWQQGAARALGRIRAPGAIEPLMKVALSPRKGDVSDAAIEALVSIGAPAGEVAAKVLKGEHEALVKYLEQEREAAVEADVGDVGERTAEALRTEVAATVLARIGRSEHTADILKAIEQADEMGRARIAMALPSLPRDEATSNAFKSVYEKAPIDLPIHKRHTGVSALMAVAPEFLEPALTPWIVDTAVKLEGGDTGLAPFREAAMLAAMKLMTGEQLTKVEELGLLITQEKWRTDFDLAKALLAKCEKKAPCYLEALTPRDKKDLFESVKAATMAGIYAVDGDRDALVKALLADHELEVRQALALAIDRVTPKGDLKLADDIEAALPSIMLSDPSIAMVLSRLRARAG